MSRRLSRNGDDPSGHLSAHIDEPRIRAIITDVPARFERFRLMPRSHAAVLLFVVVVAAAFAAFARDGSVASATIVPGTITTVAGGGVGDGGPPTAANVQAQAVAVDGSGDLYVADVTNCRIRKVSGGAITTVAGNGVCGYTGDGGSPTAASINAPWGIAVDSGGGLFFSDRNNSVVRRVSGGTITTVAGNGVYNDT